MDEQPRVRRDLLPAGIRQNPPVRALRATAAFDGERFVPGGATVLVDGPAIVGVEPYGFEVPAGVEVSSYDGTLLPGLIDAHVHLVADGVPGSLERVGEMADGRDRRRHRPDARAAGGVRRDDGARPGRPRLPDAGLPRRGRARGAADRGVGSAVHHGWRSLPLPRRRGRGAGRDPRCHGRARRPRGRRRQGDGLRRDADHRHRPAGRAVLPSGPRAGRLARPRSRAARRRPHPLGARGVARDRGGRGRAGALHLPDRGGHGHACPTCSTRSPLPASWSDPTLGPNRAALQARPDRAAAAAS